MQSLVNFDFFLIYVFFLQMEAPVPKITYEDLKDVLRKYIVIFFLWQDPIPQGPKKTLDLNLV